MVISYSGRMVPEKVSRGENGALCDANLRELARQGAVVMIYGNVQPGSTDSRGCTTTWFGCRRSWRTRSSGPRHGALRLEPARSDRAAGGDRSSSAGLRQRAQPQLSFADGKPVGTEAAGYTEAPVGRFAGLQMGPVEVHGLLNRVGTLVDWSKPRSGSCCSREAPTSAAYLEEMLTAARHFKRSPRLYYSMGQPAYALGVSTTRC